VLYLYLDRLSGWSVRARRQAMRKLRRQFGAPSAG
jgi:hypothetical protein